MNNEKLWRDIKSSINNKYNQKPFSVTVFDSSVITKKTCFLVPTIVFCSYKNDYSILCHFICFSIRRRWDFINISFFFHSVIVMLDRASQVAKRLRFNLWSRRKKLLNKIFVRDNGTAHIAAFKVVFFLTQLRSAISTFLTLPLIVTTIMRGKKNQSFWEKFETRCKTIIIRSLRRKLSVWRNQLIEADEVCIIFSTAQLSVHASVCAIWCVFIIQRNAKSREMNVNVFLVIAYLELHRGVDNSVIMPWLTSKQYCSLIVITS